MFAEDRLQRRHHGRKFRVIRRRHVGTAARASRKSFEIEILRVWEIVFAVYIAAEKIAHMLGTRIAFAHARIVRAKLSQECFIIVQKWSRVREPLVPDHHNPAAGFQNAGKLPPCRAGLKPVKGLSRRDEIHAGIVQRCGFRRPVHTREAIERSEIFLARLPHRFVGLHAVYAVAIL